jgi:hypothetical protein
VRAPEERTLDTDAHLNAAGHVADVVAGLPEQHPRPDCAFHSEVASA